MDLVVRSPHGDADVSIDTDVTTTTLGDTVAAVTGQAVPAIVVVDGRTLPASTPLADENVRIGSVLSTVTVDQERAVDPAINLLQHAGPGAGSIRPLGRGRYRIGPGRRLSATELAEAPVEQVAFELEIVADTVTVHPVADSPVVVGGRTIVGPTVWTGGDLVTGARVFGFEHAAGIVAAGRRSADPDGTVPFGRTAGAVDDRSTVDVVHAAVSHDSSLWRRRLDPNSPISVPIGLVDDGGTTLRRVSLTIGPDRGAALVGPEDFVEAIARAVVLGALTAHGPADLGVVVATTPDRVGRWDWLKWAPHARMGGGRSILATDTALRRWAAGLPSTSPTSTTLLIVDDDERWNRRNSPFREVVSSPPPSVRLVVLCDRADRAPASCRTVVAREGQFASMTSLAPAGQSASPIGISEFLPSLVEPAVAAEAARAIASLVDIDRDDTAVSDGSAATPVLAETLDAITVGDGDQRAGWPSPVWIGNTDVGDRVVVDWADTSIVSVHASDHHDLDALAVTIVAGLVAHRRPSDLPVLLVGDGDAATLVGLLSDLPHVGGRCGSGDAFERRRVLARLEHVASYGEICVVLAGGGIGGWLTDMVALVGRMPAVRLVVAQSGDIDGGLIPPQPGLVEIDVTRQTGYPVATMTRTTLGGGHEEARFIPVVFAAPPPTGGLALRPFVIGRPLTSLERRLARAEGPQSESAETTRALLGSMGRDDWTESASVPILVPPALPTTIADEDLLARNEADAIPVGLADDTARADFPVVWWHPGDAGTWLFIGSPRAELDSALWTILPRCGGALFAGGRPSGGDRFLEPPLVDGGWDAALRPRRSDRARRSGGGRHRARRRRTPRAPHRSARRAAEHRVARERSHAAASPLGRQRVLVRPRFPAVARHRWRPRGERRRRRVLRRRCIRPARRRRRRAGRTAHQQRRRLHARPRRRGDVGMQSGPVLVAGDRPARATGLFALPPADWARARGKRVTMERTGRGDGIGIELTRGVVRGVLLAADEPDRLRAATEVGIRHFDDDRSVLDALIRLRAELGQSRAPTRVALFPPGSTLHRVDVTSQSGPELNVTRSRLLQVDGVSSTVLIDDGPRRWLYAVRWDDRLVRRLEELVEHAGFGDVAIDPSPVALSRLLVDSVMARRDAAPGESFDMVLAGLPIVATASDGVGRQPPDLLTSSVPVSFEVFEGLTDAADLAAQIQQAATLGLDRSAPASSTSPLDLAGVAHPAYPRHDIRSPERQCVALGAAVGAAGLTGRLRPIDMMLPSIPAATTERPWAIERVSAVPTNVEPRPMSTAKRVATRLVPRRKH